MRTDNNSSRTTTTTTIPTKKGGGGFRADKLGTNPKKAQKKFKNESLRPPFFEKGGVGVLQVLVPCYTEPIEIVAETVWAAHQAPQPCGCTATVWLLDDGRDDHKAAWVEGLATSSIRYLSGRQRRPGRGFRVWASVWGC